MDFCETIKEDLDTLIQQVEEETATDDYIIFKVEWLLESMGQVLAVTGQDFPDPLKDALRSILEHLQRAVVQRHPGRLKIPTPTTSICWYLQLGLTVPAIAKIFGVSLRTIRRRMEESDVR